MRIIRIKYPDNSIKLYCFSDAIATSGDLTSYLPVELYNTEITSLNNLNYEFTISLQTSGNYEIWILSIPEKENDAVYDVGDIMMGQNAPARVIYKMTKPNVFSTVYTDINFTDIPENYINKLSLYIDCEFFKNVTCIMSKVNKSFCKNCNCAHICNNKNAMAIVKASLLLAELNMQENNSTEYIDMVNQFKPAMKTLCQCS